VIATPILDRHVTTVGIIGAGAKGTVIAIYALLGGYQVMLEDISSTRLSEAKARISTALDGAAARGEVDSSFDKDISANLRTTHSVDELSRAADLLIEAAPEDAELQLEIFTIFDKFAKPDAILASTARVVSISALAEMTNYPERCIGLQFPETQGRDCVLGMVRAPKTSERTLQICADFARAIGLAPETVSEAAPVPAAPEKHIL
jgi:3-hydroxyacyl-CoA dehydrogenase